MSTDTFDVVVLGGGPAGAAAALTLRRSGLHVLVIERSDYHLPRIGETLAPGAEGLIDYLGVGAALRESGHLMAFGTDAAWGSPQVQSRDFINTPFGHGWHLDRRRFDQALAAAAQQAGALLWTAAQVEQCAQITPDDWQLRVRHAGGVATIAARFLIDASGKRASLARRQGAVRRQYDRLVGVAGRLCFPGGVAPNTFTLVETYADGWWYSARLPDDSLLVVLMSDSDLVRQHMLQTSAGWWAALTQMQHSGARAAGGRLAGPLQVYAAHSARLEQPFGAGWVATGDAAASFDPLSSSGIPRALDSGIRAAQAVDALLRRGNPGALQSYADTLSQSFALYLDTWARYYRMEQRWPTAPFWRRRQHVISLDPHSTLRYHAHAEPAPGWAELGDALPRYVYSQLCDLCRTGSPAHLVVAAFQAQHGPRWPDHQVILGLQELVRCGVVTMAHSR